MTWLDCMRREADVSYVDRLTDLHLIDELIEKKQKLEKELIDPTKQIQALSSEVLILEHKSQASAVAQKITNYVEWLKWDAAVRTLNLSSVRGSITKKKTELMSQLVMARYVGIFNEECKALNCDFGLSIASYGKDVSTVKGLKLDFAKSIQPGDILSEGEQTVSALADFLTEAKVDLHNVGIIFDDPVTSLDHGRRDTIAGRLASEAKCRQVIILTHDIAFLLELEYYAQLYDVPCNTVSLNRIGDRVGLVGPELPWPALDVKKRVGILKNKLPQLKKAELEDPNIYRDNVKSWYGLLRESWERCVEERLFKGVIQRFNKSVQTLRLGKVVVTPELINEVTKGMTEASKWVHDMAAIQNSAVPRNAKLEQDLKSLEDFLGKCKQD